MQDAIAAERAAARFLIVAALGVIAVVMAWFAYIDAPISDAVMLTVAVAIGAGVVATLTALVAYSAALDRGGPAGEAPGSCRRLRRVALLALATMVLLAAVAMVATLNVRGDDSDGGGSTDQATTGSV
ncbi:MAG: hypothetical protein KGL34_13645 [Gammaproteobacteria bacterium]|nr:hypothetical protein [Gammaproteobacteria bacterium]